LKEAHEQLTEWCKAEDLATPTYDDFCRQVITKDVEAAKSGHTPDKSPPSSEKETGSEGEPVRPKTSSSSKAKHPRSGAEACDSKEGKGSEEEPGDEEVPDDVEQLKREIVQMRKEKQKVRALEKKVQQQERELERASKQTMERMSSGGRKFEHAQVARKER